MMEGFNFLGHGTLALEQGHLFLEITFFYFSLHHIRYTFLYFISYVYLKNAYYSKERDGNINQLIIKSFHS